MQKKFISLILLLVLMSNLTAEAQLVKPNKPAQKTESKEKAEENAILIKYTGGETNKDPFGLPMSLVKIISNPSRKGEEPSAVVLPVMNIQGIIWNKKMPQAIINNGVKKVGDLIEKFEIQEITREAVVLFYKGKTYKVKIK